MKDKGGDDRAVVAARLKDDFIDRLLVDCPACGGKAVVTPTAPPAPGMSADTAARRLVCHDCAYTRDQEQTPMGRFTRPSMGQTLRLRAVTRHGELVAWNEDHLDYLEHYLAGRLRSETHEDGGIRNRSIISRLPAWVKSAKNRDEVLKAIAKLRREKL